MAKVLGQHEHDKKENQKQEINLLERSMKMP